MKNFTVLASSTKIALCSTKEVVYLNRNCIFVIQKNDKPRALNNI